LYLCTSVRTTATGWQPNRINILSYHITTATTKHKNKTRTKKQRKKIEHCN
jgi:hypothetical protein